MKRYRSAAAWDYRQAEDGSGWKQVVFANGSDLIASSDFNDLIPTAYG